jgi:hypothetical protein
VDYGVSTSNFFFPYLCNDVYYVDVTEEYDNSESSPDVEAWGSGHICNKQANTKSTNLAILSCQVHLNLCVSHIRT